WCDLEKQDSGVLGGQLVQIAREEAREREVEAGGHEQQGALWRQQRLNLVATSGVVHEEESALAVEYGPVQPRQLCFAFGEPRLRMARPDDVRHRLRRGERLRVHSFEIEVELGVWVGGCQILGELQGEDRLADATHTGRPKIALAPPWPSAERRAAR